MTEDGAGRVTIGVDGARPALPQWAGWRLQQSLRVPQFQPIARAWSAGWWWNRDQISIKVPDLAGWYHPSLWCRSAHEYFAGLAELDTMQVAHEVNYISVRSAAEAVKLPNTIAREERQARRSLLVEEAERFGFPPIVDQLTVVRGNIPNVDPAAYLIGIEAGGVLVAWKTEGHHAAPFPPSSGRRLISALIHSAAYRNMLQRA